MMFHYFSCLVVIFYAITGHAVTIFNLEYGDINTTIEYINPTYSVNKPDILIYIKQQNEYLVYLNDSTYHNITESNIWKIDKQYNMCQFKITTLIPSDNSYLIYNNIFLLSNLDNINNSNNTNNSNN